MSPPQDRNPPLKDAATAAAGELTVVFDGDCPVCTAYTCNMDTDRPARVVNARAGGALVEELAAAGYDLDEGMIVIKDGQHYHGAAAVQLMALHSRRRGLLNRLNHLVFRSAARSRALYPLLRAGRNLLLRILGRKKINDSQRR